MKKILTASVISMAMATSAMAQSNTDSDDVIINASVAKECSIGDIEVMDLGQIPIVETPGPDALQLTDEPTIANQDAWVSCNFPNTMTLSVSTPLVSQTGLALASPVATGSASFTNEIDYRFRAVNYANSPEANSFSRASVTSNRSNVIHKLVTFRAIVNGSDNVGIRPVAADDYTATATMAISTL